MSEFFRKYWFVCVIAVALIVGLGYYIVDLNKDNVSAKKADGVDVVASTSLGDVTSDEIFDGYQSFNQSLLYNMYQRAVIDQAVEATDEMKDQAKTMTRNLKSNMDADDTGKTRYSIISELASYGFEGEESLNDYFLFALKARALDKQYILDHYDEYANTLTTSPRTISIITLENIPNADILTDETQEKKDAIDAALENGDDFGEVAKEYSENTDTADDNGYYGYIDSSSSDLDADVITAAVGLEAGETSEWITVQDSSTGYYTMYLVRVEETDPKAILEGDDSDASDSIVSAFVSANSTLEGKAVAKAAEGLDIEFYNDDVKEKIEAAIASATGADSEEEETTEESAEESENTDSETEEAADEETEASEENNEENTEEQVTTQEETDDEAAE